MIEIAIPDLQIHVTPLESLAYDGRDLVVEFDDVNEHRVSLKFSPCQGIRVTTIDCFDMQQLLVEGELHRNVLEQSNSAWIATLSAELHKNDHTASFMQQSHHYILPFQDNVVEVIAWGFTLR